MHFEVNRQDFHQTRVVEPAPRALEPGEIELAVERFAVTTNNITYAVAGDMLDYWGFFPTDAPWGRIPAMGLASVAASANPDVAVGGRYFGFFPMADRSVILAEARGSAFRDVGAHRANHAAAYTEFRDVASDPLFREEKADEYLLLWGLFMTSFLADDQLADSDFHGAAQTLVTSASSKTSIALAACLADRAGHRSVGVTSDRNRAFVEGLELYDEVVTYDAVADLDADVASGMVDMAGGGSVRSSIHTHFGDNLRFSLTVGATHWQDQDVSADLPGPTPEFFFAPGQAAKRTAEWGADALAERIAAAFHRFVDDAERWLRVRHHEGADGMEQVYRELLDGRADPAEGHIVSMR